MRSMFVDGRYDESKPSEGPLQGEGRGYTSLDVPVEGPLLGNLSRGFLWIGRNTSIITVDEIRISSVARTPEEIKANWQKAPTRDAYTLLLDHCDGGAAEVITGVPGAKLEGACKVVDGRFGKAIQLWVE